jgi:hypothetical protein
MLSRRANASFTALRNDDIVAMWQLMPGAAQRIVSSAIESG